MSTLFGPVLGPLDVLAVMTLVSYIVLGAISYPMTWRARKWYNKDKKNHWLVSFIPDWFYGGAWAVCYTMYITSVFMYLRFSRDPEYFLYVATLVMSAIQFFLLSRWSPMWFDAGKTIHWARTSKSISQPKREKHIRKGYAGLFRATMTSGIALTLSIIVTVLMIVAAAQNQFGATGGLLSVQVICPLFYAIPTLWLIYATGIQVIWISLFDMATGMLGIKPHLPIVALRQEVRFPTNSLRSSIQHSLNGMNK